MSARADGEGFEAAVAAVQALIELWNNRGVVIGGVAVSLVSRPRFTADVDAVLLADVGDVETILRHARECALAPRVADPLGFALQTRVLPLRHEPSATPVDISLGVLPF